MRVLLITGDKSFGPGHPRYELQKSAVEELAVMYWGHGAFFPRIPQGAFDVVTVQDPLLRGVFARHVAKKIGARFNVQVHMDLESLPWWKHILAQIVLRHASSVRVVSQKIQQQVTKFGVRAPVAVLPVFVDTAPFAGLVHQQHPRFAKTILWLGRFEPEKNPLAALRVLEGVRAAGIDAGLIFLGAGSLERELREAAQSLEGYVEFAGWQKPAPFFALADVVLSTSHHESWGASIVEALAAGVPVVAPDVGVAREAGARVVPEGQLATEVVRVLQGGLRGELKLTLLSRQEWAQAWQKTLQ